MVGYNDVVANAYTVADNNVGGSPPLIIKALALRLYLRISL